MPAARNIVRHRAAQLVSAREQAQVLDLEEDSKAKPPSRTSLVSHQLVEQDGDGALRSAVHQVKREAYDDARQIRANCNECEHCFCSILFYTVARGPILCFALAIYLHQMPSTPFPQSESLATIILLVHGAQYTCIHVHMFCAIHCTSIVSLPTVFNECFLHMLFCSSSTCHTFSQAYTFFKRTNR